MPNALLRMAAAAAAFALCAPMLHAATRVIDSRVGSIVLRTQQVAEIRTGASVDWLDLFDQSRVAVSGGSVGWFTLHNDADALIDGGEIARLSLLDHSSATITYAQDLDWLTLYGNASRVEIVANNVTYSQGRLNGTWANGTAFSFWAFNAQNYYPSDVMPANLIIAPVPRSLVVSAVPEPGSALLFSAGAIVAFFGSRRRLDRAPKPARSA